MSGFVSISRDIMNSWVYNADDPHYFKWWFDLYTSAAYQEKEVMFGRHIVRIHKRQLIASVRHLSRRWGVSAKKVHFFLRNLIDSGMITRSVKYNIPVITIIAGYPDFLEQCQPFTGNTIIQNSNISVSDSCVNSGVSEGTVTQQQGKHLGKHYKEHHETVKPSTYGPAATPFKTENYNSSKEKESKDLPAENASRGNTSGNTFGNTNYRNNNISKKTSKRARTHEEEIGYFVGLLSEKEKFLEATARDFYMSTPNDVLPYLRKFGEVESSYAVLEERAQNTPQERFRKFQDHFRNWLRKYLRGMYPSFDPEKAERDRRTLLENRKIRKINNDNKNKEGIYGIQGDPCKRDTTQITPAKDVSEFENWDEVYFADE